MAWGSIQPIVFAFMKKNCPCYLLQLLHSPGKCIRNRRMFNEHNLKNITFVRNRFPDMEPAPCEINVDTFKSWIKAANADMDEVKAFYTKEENTLEFFLQGPNTPITKITIPKFWRVPLVLVGPAKGYCTPYLSCWKKWWSLSDEVKKIVKLAHNATCAGVGNESSSKIAVKVNASAGCTGVYQSGKNGWVCIITY